MTLIELVLAYSRSPEAVACARETKRHRQRAFDLLIDRFGKGFPVAELEDRSFRAKLYDWRDTFVGRPQEGDMVLRAVSLLFNWAVDRDAMRDNPARGIRRLNKCGAPRAEIVWKPEQIKIFLSHAELHVAEIFFTGLWTGLGPAELIALTADNFESGWLEIRRRKTGVDVAIPYYMNGELALLMNRLVNLPWAKGEPIFRARTGVPWSEKHLNRSFNEVKEAAGLAEEDLHFYDLRGTFVTRCFESECTQAEVASLIGHSLAGGWMRSYAARTHTLAEAAYTKLMEGKYGNPGTASNVLDHALPLREGRSRLLGSRARPAAVELDER